MRLAAACCAATLYTQPTLAVGVADTRTVAEQIDIAGRQRMLVQQIGRAACYVLGNVEVERNQKLALEGIQSFSDVQTWLRHGDVVKKWPVAVDPQLIASLDRVDALWSTLKAADSQLVYGDFHSIVVEQVMEFTNPVMAAADQTVAVLNRMLGAAADNPSYAKTLDVAGRQRMLTQRATKEFCFAALVSGSRDQKRALIMTIEEFDQSINHLLYGEDGLMEPPNVVIKAQLQRTARTWAKLTKIMNGVISGEAITQEQMIEASALSDKVLLQMNAVVFAYATLDLGIH